MFSRPGKLPERKSHPAGCGFSADVHSQKKITFLASFQGIAFASF